MQLNHQIIFFLGLLFVVSILASVISRRLGAPLLLVFLLLGMLLGQEGMGLVFDDLHTAHLVGSLALALILFDGGLSTNQENFRVGLRPALSLASFGVIITALVTGVIATWVFDLPLIYGLLLGAIVGSTDAAAVFSLLHTAKLELKQRVAASLEIESGSNDPMAIFLTVLLIEWLLLSQSGPSAWLLLEFVRQMGLGMLLGLAGGWVSLWILNRVQLSPGLYPLLAMAFGLSIFGSTAMLGGSGFLAIYLAGIYMGNRRMQAAQHIRRFHDGLAWLGQIIMFLMLGIMVVPSQVWAIALPSLLVALALIFIARPVAVVLCLLPFRFSWSEQAFISWVGLRGAVPIILAIFPALYGIDNASFFFNVAFFVVLVSLVLQGWTIPLAARLFRVEIPPQSQRLERLALDLPGHSDLELTGYQLQGQSQALTQGLDRLRLPEKAKLLFCLRQHQLLAMDQVEQLQAGDQLYLICPPEYLRQLDRLFVDIAVPERLNERSFFGEFAINGDARLGDLAMLYGFELAAELESVCLHDYLCQRFGSPVVGDRLSLGDIELVVRVLEGNRCVQVGLKLPH